LTFSIIKKNVNKIITASEDSIISAMETLHKIAGILAEPSSSVPLAVIIENKSLFKGKKIGIIISGGNV